MVHAARREGIGEPFEIGLGRGDRRAVAAGQRGVQSLQGAEQCGDFGIVQQRRAVAVQRSAGGLDQPPGLDLLLEARAEAERLVELCPDAAEGMKDFEKKYIRSEEVTGSRLSRSLSLIS